MDDGLGFLFRLWTSLSVHLSQSRSVYAAPVYLPITPRRTSSSLPPPPLSIFCSFLSPMVPRSVMSDITFARSLVPPLPSFVQTFVFILYTYFFFSYDSHPFIVHEEKKTKTDRPTDRPSFWLVTTLFKFNPICSILLLYRFLFCFVWFARSFGLSSSRLILHILWFFRHPTTSLWPPTLIPFRGRRAPSHLWRHPSPIAKKKRRKNKK